MRWSLLVLWMRCCPLLCCVKKQGRQGSKKKAAAAHYHHHHHEAETNQQQQQAGDNNLEDENNNNNKKKQQQQQNAERIIQKCIISIKKRKDEKKWRLEHAETKIQTYRISDTTMIIPYAEWSHKQDIIDTTEIASRGVRAQKKKEYVYYGPIGGSETFVFFQGKVKVCHCSTKSELDFGPTTNYSVVDSLLLPQEKKQFVLWIQAQHQQQEEEEQDQKKAGRDELEEKDISFQVTESCIGTIIKATNPQTGDMIDLTDYDWWI